MSQDLLALAWSLVGRERMDRALAEAEAARTEGEHQALIEGWWDEWNRGE